MDWSTRSSPSHSLSLKEINRNKDRTMLTLERLEDRCMPSALFLDLGQVAMMGPLTKE